MTTTVRWLLVLPLIGGLLYLVVVATQADTKIATTTSPGTLADGLVAHYTFDGEDTDWSSTTAEIRDVSGNGDHGNAVNLLADKSTTVGVLGQGIELDGVSDYVQDLNLDGISTGNIAHTISAWLKIDELPTSQRDSVLVLGDLSAGNHHWLLETDSEMAVGVWSDPSGRIYQDVPVGEWFLLTVTSDTNVIKSYVDGVLSGSSVDAEFNFSGVPLRLGEAIENNFDGSVDDVRIYNRALSAAEVQRLYQLGEGTKVAQTLTTNPSLTDGLVGHWTFDGPDVDWGSSTAEIKDRSGNGNHGDATTTMSTQSVASGRVGQAFVFDGVSDVVSVSATSNVQAVSYWIKADSKVGNGGIGLNSDRYLRELAIPEGWSDPVVYIDGEQQTMYGADLVTNGDFDSDISDWETINSASTVSWNSGTSGNGSAGYHSFNIQSNAWWDRYRFETGIINPSTAYKVSFWYYLTGVTGNGVRPFFTDNFTGMNNYVVGPDLKTNTGWQYKSFTMNSTALSDPIFGFHKHSSIGSGNFRIDGITITEITNTDIIDDLSEWHHVVVSSDVVLTADAITFGKARNTYLDGVLDEVRFYNRALTSDEARQLYRLGGESEISTTVTGADSPLETGLVGHWTFDGPDVDWGSTTAEIKDRSGNGNHGDATSTMNTRSVTPGPVGQAMSFDGVDDYVSIRDNTTPLYTASDITTQGITLAAWAKTPDAKDGTVRCVVCLNGSLPHHYGSAGGLQVLQGLSWIQPQATIWDGSVYITAEAPQAYGLEHGQFAHLVAVFDPVDDQVRLYVNGRVAVEQSGNVSSADQDASYAAIANKIGVATYVTYHDGSVDDVRIYNRTLSAKEVEMLYQLGR